MPPSPVGQEFASEVRMRAETYGWLPFLAQDSWLFLTNGVSVLCVLLLEEGESPSPEQALRYTALMHTQKVECHVWRPANLRQLVHLLDRETR